MRARLFFLFGIFLIISLIIVSAQSSFSGVSGSREYSSHQLRPSLSSAYGNDYKTYWPILDDDPSSCEARQDLILNVAPVGCQPAVVRSDLLAEQNVPVFCQIDAFKINPLIDIKEIRSIGFRGEYPEGVIGAGFHPAKSALRSYDRLLGSPLINNIGYVVIVLGKQSDESEIPDEIEVDLAGRIEYESGNAIGIGRTEFILEPMNEEEWVSERNRQSFWKGMYFVRLEEADSSSAVVSIYSGDRKITTTKVERGKMSGDIFVPGSYCRAGLHINYDGLESDQDRARIEVKDDSGTDVFDIFQGSKFLNGKCRVDRLDIVGKDEGKVSVRCGKEGFDLELGRVILEEKEMLEDKKLGDQLDKYFQNAIDYYEDIVGDYPGVRKDPETEASRKYGELALEAAIELAKDMGKVATEENLINSYLEVYPDSDRKEGLIVRLDELRTIDFGLASRTINLDNGFKSIRLIGMEKVGKKSEAVFRINNREVIVESGELREDIGLKTGIRVDSIMGQDEVNVRGFCIEGDNRRESKKGVKTLRIGDPGIEFCAGELVALEDVDVDLVARVRLTPKAIGTGTETNLTVRIGIEKRVFELTPEKAARKIENLNESIARWEGINDGLGKVVEGMKAACFATSAVLTAKNFLTGAGGESLARQKVMQAPGGWGDKCEIHFAKGTVEEGHTSYNSVDDCFRQNADAINTDVGRMTTLIQNYNNEVSQLEMEGGFVESVGFLGVKNINSGKSANARLEGLIEEFSDGGSITFGEETINFEEFAETEGIENAYNYGYISNSQLQNIVINKRILESEDASQILEEGARQSLFEDLKSVKEGLESEAGKSQLIEALQDKISGEILIDNYAESGRIRALYRGGKYNGGISGIEVEDRNIQIVNFGNVKYAFILGDEDGGDYNIEGIYELDNVGKVGTNLKTRFDGLGPSESLSPADKDFAERYKVLKKFNFEKLDAASYQNVFVKPEVRYFETEPFKGMPAVVPFDLREGWYVATRQSLAIFDGGGAFESSGRAAVFWLCNVGKNGKVDFDRTGFGDDECRQFNAAADQPPDFQGLSKQKSVRLVQRAMKALQDASSQYSIGRTHIGIEGDQIPIGNPAVNVPSTRCQDFMSPEECHLLFNVCDPVICPSSRCDLGGKYPVSDIVQSGVVGSIALCLPNVKEGIFIPVCLTGIHAGLESWVSILKSHRDCLQHNVETGQYVGICDEITSIYMCEFFWRQLAPIVDVLIPRLVEIAYGQGVRGGGEYLTVMAAWNNMQASINQFTQNYAVNSLNAFKVRNVQEAGGQFCKAFISAKAPTAFESLIEPDSPSQFYAWFDSIPFTDATVPATSQYKVYYHIFAGNDQGVQYSVFLKNPPELSFFAIPEIVHVASGFVPRGESADETVDFTAPDGYKELCVRINDKEECGFRQVTTSFGLNFVRDKFVSEELQRADISTEDECIGGSPGFGALLNPNLQSGVEELVSPEVYNRGVVRICSTSNPGSQTEPTRFVKVGSCDNERVGCWLDKKSFDNALTDSNKLLRNATISELEEVQLESSGFLADDSGEFISKIKEFNDAKEKLKKSFGESQGIGKESSLESRIDILTGEIGQLFDKLFINWHKAQATFILAEVYEIGARALKPGSVEKISAQVEDKEREVLVEGDFEINGDIVIINEGKVKELSSEDKIIEFAAGEFAKNLGAGWSVRTINKDEGLVLFYKKEDSDSMYFMISSDSEKKIVEFSDAPFTGVDLGSGIEDFEFYSNGGRVSRISLFDDVLLRVSHNCDSVGLLVTHSRTSFNIDEVVIVDKDYEITPDSGRYTAKADCKINGEIVSSEERQLIVEEVLGN